MHNKPDQKYTGVIRIDNLNKRTVLMSIDEFMSIDIDFIYLNISSANEITIKQFENIQVVITAVSDSKNKVSLKMPFGKKTSSPSIIFPGNIIHKWIKATLELSKDWMDIQIGMSVHENMNDSVVLCLFYDTCNQHIQSQQCYSAKQVIEMLDFSYLSMFMKSNSDNNQLNFKKLVLKHELSILVKKKIDRIKDLEAMTRVKISFNYQQKSIRKEHIYSHPELHSLYTAFSKFMHTCYIPLVETAIELNKNYEVVISETGIETIIQNREITHSPSL